MIKKYILNRIKNFLKNDLYYDLLEKSILKAVKEQKLDSLMLKLFEIADDTILKGQYTFSGYNDYNHHYWFTTVRALHTFQINLVLHTIEKFKLSDNNLTIVDIGDSSGNHSLYLKQLLDNVKTLSINLDSKAIEKIKKKGFDAICCRAEELEKYNIQTDIFLCFQMLEHLISPITFLKELSDRSNCKYLIVTVPYITKSRVSLNYIRLSKLEKQFAEKVHVFELNPCDWNLLFKFAGWKIKYSKIYLQYPKKGLLKFTKHFFKQYDFEGFYGVLLEKDDYFSKLYKDW